jgi:hypothetical protein
MNKKAMIGNIIGGFIAILIGVTLIPMISQEINNAINCNSTSNMTAANISSDYYGKTGSFGGGGTEHFGGYTGTVAHKVWGSDLALYKTNQTYSGICLNNLDPLTSTMLGIVPVFFALAILMMGIAIVYNSLRNSGLISGGEEI